MNQRGLTLVEVLIALAVFSAISAIGVGAMSLAARGSEQLDAAAARIGEIERFRGLLRADLHQLVPRPVLEPDTDRPRPPLMGGRALADVLDTDEEVPLLAVVRGGWANPGAREPRAELQAVTWLAAEGRLIRRQRPYLDAVADTPYRDDIILEGLEEITVEFLERSRWRDETGRPDGDDEGTAVALRLGFIHPVYGPMEHVFLIGGAG